MFTCNRILIFFGAVIACSSCATAFFLNWGSSEVPTNQRPIQAYPVTAYYQQRLLQAPPPPNYAGNQGDQPLPVQIPAIPIQVPLQAQFSPANNVHNVQLVPCLCPVSSDFEYERAQEGSSVFVNQIKPPQNGQNGQN